MNLKSHACVIFFATLMMLPVYGESSKQCIAMLHSATTGLAINSSEVILENKSLPAYCKIRGKIAKRVGFEARFPIENWNNAIFMAGCGGFCGVYHSDRETFSNSINPALRKGYATLITDSGHQGKSYEASWAFDDDVALELYAHSVLPIAVSTLQHLVKQFYNKEENKKIFSGCSNGGRMGLMAAQRYPELFDGILVGGPILDLTGNAGHHGAWLVQQIIDSQGNRILTSDTVRILGPEVMRQCDELDGQTDGVISNPLACEPDLSKLSCNTNPSKDCLSKNEISTIQAIYKGVHDPDGKRLFPGILPGGEHNWPLWIIGNDKVPGWGYLAGKGYLGLAAKKIENLKHDASNYNFASDARALENSNFPKLLDSKDPDLSSFKKAGGKMIYWHGWADSLILPERSLGYYKEVVNKNTSLESTKEFTRLFMVPGHGHCWGMPGKGPDQFDPIAAMDSWLSEDKAPDYLMAHEKNKQGDIIRSRPICAYPKVAKLADGKDPDSSDSYLCKIDTDYYSSD